jgi:hypothetical protein
MVEQLQQVLAKPLEPSGDGNILRTTLAYEPVASAIDLPTLLAGLRRINPIIARSIIERINRKFPTDDATIDFWTDAINRDDYSLLRELVIAKNVRSPKLVEPLVACIERDRQWVPYFALRLLYHQRSVMPDPAAVAKRIAPIILKRTPWLERGELDMAKHVVWYEQMENLALTGDPAMATYFLPYLKSKAIAFRARDMSLINNGVDTRVCDVAYNNLLILLDKPGEPFTMFFAKDMFGPTLDPAKEHARRDKLIAELKAELDRLGKGP